MGRPTAAAALAALERIARRYGPGLSVRKLKLLDRLEASRLPTPGALRRLHELACLLDAYPDDRTVRARARRILGAFGRRPDLRRHRRALAGSGIAGTDTPYRFYWPTARWLSRRWPGALVIDREDPELAQDLLDALPLLLPQLQAVHLKELAPPTLDVLDRLRPRDVTDADWFIGLVSAMPGDEATREAFFDRIDPPFVLNAGPTTPERSTRHFDALAFEPQRESLRGARPDLRRERLRPPRRVVALRAGTADALVDLARISMVTRERDLAAFQYANRRDAFLVDDGRGLGFAFVGMRPERRLLLPAVYGGLTLQNGVPIGYVQLDLLGRHAELSFNQFETFRDGGAARVFARLVAITHRLFGCDSFSIEPYQLGEGNAEGVESGAWWFYRRFGFRPRDRQARRLATQEERRAAGRPGYRTPVSRLRRLARAHLFYSLAPGRSARLPRIAPLLARANEELSRFVHRDAAAREAAAISAAAAWLGVARPSARLRTALAAWAGIVLALSRRRGWSRTHRRQLLELVLAKRARREIEFQRRLMPFARLRRTLDC